MRTLSRKAGVRGLRARPLIGILVAVGLTVPVMWAPQATLAASQPHAAFGTAQVDGTIAPGEWDLAVTIAMTVDAVTNGQVERVPAQALLMNDASNLYLALRIGRPLAYAGFWGDFDADGDRVFEEPGDDMLFASTDGRFTDAAWIPCVIDGIARGTCAPDDLHIDAANPVAGTIDGRSAARRGGGLDTIEIVHPLASGDARDISLASGDVVGVRVSVQAIDDAYGMPCTDTACGAETAAVGRVAVARPGQGGAAPIVTARVSPSPTGGWQRPPVTVTMTGGTGTRSISYWTTPAGEGGARRTSGGETLAVMHVGARMATLVLQEGNTIVHWFATGTDGRTGPWGAERILVDGSPPEVAGPAVVFATGSTLGSGSTLVRWAAADAFSGVSRSVVQESPDLGRTWTTTLKVDRQSVRRSLSVGQSYTYRVRTFDRVGNGSTWRYLVDVRPAITDATHSTFTLTGTWRTNADAAAFGGSVLSSTTGGSTAGISVYGNAVALAMRTAPDHGMAVVLLDGVEVATISLKGPTAPRRIVWTQAWSVAAWHRVVIRVPASPTGAVDLDAIAVLSPGVRLEPYTTTALAHVEGENLPAVGTPTPVVETRPSDLVGRWNANRQLAWRPVGPGMLWVGVPVAVGRYRAVVFVTKGPDYGIATFRFGSAPPQRVDLWAPRPIRYPLYFDPIEQRSWGVVVFEAEVVGRNPASSGYGVGIDLIMLEGIPGTIEAT